jgi:hypothetical protein
MSITPHLHLNIISPARDPHMQMPRADSAMLLLTELKGSASIVRRSMGASWLYMMSGIRGAGSYLSESRELRSNSVIHVPGTPPFGACMGRQWIANLRSI